jgi:hypothetical protein
MQELWYSTHMTRNAGLFAYIIVTDWKPSQTFIAGGALGAINFIARLRCKQMKFFAPRKLCHGYLLK